MPYRNESCNALLSKTNDMAREWAQLCPVSCTHGQLLGDLNRNGRVTRADSEIMLSMRVGIISQPDNILCCGDLTLNEEFTEVDAVRVLRIAAGYSQAQQWWKCGQIYVLPPCINGQKVGDADGDGRILDFDADVIRSIAEGRFTMPANICCADANKDGTVTSADQTLVLNSRNSGMPEPNFGVCQTTVKCEPGQLIGDANGDGSITDADVKLLQRALVRIDPMPQNTCCVDMNENGQVNSFDVVVMRRIVDGLDPVPTKKC